MISNSSDGISYKLISLLGKGGSSKVFKAADENGLEVAIKVIRKDKKFDYETSWNMLAREHILLQILSPHPNIINSINMNFDGQLSLDENFENERICYNVLEYAPNGVLSHIIKNTGPIEENIWKFLMIQLFNAVKFIHSQGHWHLDIKLENILLDKFYNIKLADLGSSIEVENTQGFTNRRRGTIMYMAPEVKNLVHGEEFNAYKADIYSLGVTLFVMLTGEFPAQELIEKELSTWDCWDEPDNNNEELWNWAEARNWDSLSKEVRLLLKEMVCWDPESRPSIQEILSNDWLRLEIDQAFLYSVYNEMSWRKNVADSLKTKSSVI